MTNKDNFEAQTILSFHVYLYTYIELKNFICTAGNWQADVKKWNDGVLTQSKEDKKAASDQTLLFSMFYKKLWKDKT